MAERFMLLVDGPGSGELVPHDHNAIEYLPPEEVPATVPPEGTSPAARPVLYHVHKLALFGRVVTVGSVQSDAHHLAHDDLWAALVSLPAQAASRDAWCPWGEACPADLGERHRVTRACLEHARGQAAHG